MVQKPQLFCVVLLLTIFASPSTLATGLLDLMDPSSEALVSACATGYSDRVGQTNSRYLLNLGTTPSVVLQTPLATAMIVCQNAAKASKPRPDPSQIASEALVYVSGQVSKLEEAKTVTASIVLRDVGGAVNDLFPEFKGNRIALEQDWERKCTNDSCVFIGRNTLHFLVTNDLKAKLRQPGVRLEVQVIRQGAVQPILLSTTISAPTPTTPLDTSFGQAGGVYTEFVSGNATAFASALQSDGKLIAGGVAGLRDAYSLALARYEAIGTPDKRFGVDGQVEERLVQDGFLTDLAVQPDGKVIGVGYGMNVVATDTGGDVVIVRFTRSGSLDPGFGIKGLSSANISIDDHATRVSIQPDGKILVAGYTLTRTGSLIFLARLLPNGQGDPSFGTRGLVVTQLGSAGVAYGMALQTDGRIVVTGRDGSNGNQDTSVATLRYLPNGQLDPEFGRDGRTITTVGPFADGAFQVVIQPDGKLIVAGRSSDGKKARFLLLRYDSMGKIDLSFGGDGTVITEFPFNAGVFDVGLRRDGKIVAVGFVGPSGTQHFAIARYLSDGTPDSSFGVEGRWVQSVGGDAVAYALEVLPDDSVMVVGSSGVGTLRQFVLCKLSP